jgi:hypothetical protein
MTVTDQQILCALREAYHNLAISGAQSYTINAGGGSRTLTRFDLPDIQRAIAWFEERVDAAFQPGIGGGTLLAAF